MTNNRKIYLLDPKELSPEIIAVAFAKTSRSPKSFQEIADELSEESSAEFNEKWVVGYGHASVAEHAVLHIAVENVSRLAIECIESNRLASFTEKSTRYQKWGPHSFYIPVELNNNLSLLTKYKDACRLLFDTYHQSVPVVKQVVQQENPQRPGESAAAWDRRIRTDYVDVCRFFLPACSLANVGITINSRSLENALRKMLSHPLDEVRQIGEEIKAVAMQTVPTLVKYADAVKYFQDLQFEVPQFLKEDSAAPVSDSASVKLISADVDGENRILASAMYHYGDQPFEYYLHKVTNLSPAEKRDLASIILAHRSKFDPPLRELEHMNFTFEVVLDQGAYFELKRHRMMTQTPQLLTTKLGYSIPEKINQAGFTHQFENAMAAADEIYTELIKAGFHLGSYIVPNAFRRRIIMTLNLRSAFHLINLRAASNAHFSMRFITRQILEQIEQTSPLLAGYIHLENKETWQEIASTHFFKI